MKLTKYEHACFTIEKDGKVLVVDPGNLSPDFVAPENVVAVVITHQHPDHLDPEHLAEIFAKNDDVLVLGPADVIDKVEVENKKAVVPGEKVSVGPFDLEFFGGIHALIHESYPRVQNLGVLINELLYYPGDSYALPNVPIDVLAVPTSGPWLKLGEAADFVRSVHPRLAFSTHDAHSSAAGRALVDFMLPTLINDTSIEYHRLDSELEI